MINTALVELSNVREKQALPAHGKASVVVVEDSDTSDVKHQTSESLQYTEPASAKKDKSQVRKLLSSITHYATVGALLRLFGSLSMVIALGVFLLDGFQAGNHQQRFWLLLAFSAISVTTGVLMSRLFSDQKGARTMVTIALLSVPTCFAVLGALVYSLVPMDGLNHAYPEYLLWQAGNLSQLALAASVCTLITAVVSWFGFSVLAPQARLPLFATLMLSGALLVVPVRDSAWVALVGLAMIGVIAIMLLRYVLPRLTLKTHWSSFSVLMTTLPLFILIGRGAWLYGMSAAMLFASAAGLHCALLYIARRARNLPLSLIEFALFFSGAVAVLFAQPLIEDIARSGWPLLSTVASGLRNTGTLLLLGGLIVHLDLTLQNRLIARWSRIIFTAILLFAVLGIALFNPASVVEVATAAALAVLMAGYGFYRSYHSLGISGIAMIFALVLSFHNDIFGFVFGSGILGILAFGTACVFSAHLFEKYGPLIRARYSLKAKIKKQDAQQLPDMTS